MFNRLLTAFLLVFIGGVSPLHADVVKPALVEISVFNDGTFDVELRTSIEALLTGINARYKNTQQAPKAEEYDHFREMSSDELQLAFDSFKQKFLTSVF